MKKDNVTDISKWMRQYSIDKLDNITGNPALNQVLTEMLRADQAKTETIELLLKLAFAYDQKSRHLQEENAIIKRRINSIYDILNDIAPGKLKDEKLDIWQDSEEYKANKEELDRAYKVIMEKYAHEEL